MTNDTPTPSGGLFKRFSNSKEYLGLIVGILTSLTFLLGKIGPLSSSMITDELLGIVDIMNIVVLMIALFAIKPLTLTVQNSEMGQLKRHLTLNNQQNFDDIFLRVNELVKQLVHCIKWFCIILGVFYLLQFFIDSNSKIEYKSIKPVVNHSESLLQLLGRESYTDGVTNTIIKELDELKKSDKEIVDLPKLKMDAAKYLSLEIFTNATNLFSAAFLFLAFQVLFLLTIEKDNKTWSFKSAIPFAIAVLITIINIVLLLVGNDGAKLSSISHMVRLIGGIYNGVAMLLLFSRFISMEFFFKNSKSGWQRGFYLYGTVIVLPLYVIAQPMYGLFNAVEMGESPELFKAIVFLVCFWGKLIFFLFVYTMLSRKWIHMYLFMVLSQKDTLLKISKDLEDVIDLDDTKMRKREDGS